MRELRKSAVEDRRTSRCLLLLLHFCSQTPLLQRRTIAVSLLITKNQGHPYNERRSWLLHSSSSKPIEPFFFFHFHEGSKGICTHSLTINTHFLKFKKKRRKSFELKFRISDAKNLTKRG